MRVNRGLVFWGVALVTAGAVALAIQSNLIAGDTAREAWRLWPVVLIVIGVAVISARTPYAMVATLAAGLVAGGLAGTLVAGWPDGMSIGCGGETDSRTAANGDFTGASASDSRSMALIASSSGNSRRKASSTTSWVACTNWAMRIVIEVPLDLGIGK